MAEETRCFSDYASILGAQEKHALFHRKDYSHVFRKKSLIEILRLSALAIGIGCAYGAETAFVSPTLLQIGVDHTTMTMVWGLSPTFGLLLGPVLGSISDRCRLSLGRRRPMILMLSLGTVVAFICLPFGRNIGQFFGDGGLIITSMMEGNNTLAATPTTLPKGDLKITIILTVLGVFLMDCTIGMCQNPARAYMIDVCIPGDHSKILSIFSLMIGLGSTVGYAVGGIDWESTAIGKLIGGNMQTSFMIDALLFVVCFCITFFSFREIPLPLIERDKLMHPLIVRATKNGTSPNNNNQNDLLKENLPLKNTRDKEENHNISESSKEPMVIDDLNVKLEVVSLGKYLRSIIVMPKSMWILNLTNLLCWMGHTCYCLYFTDFVGEEVFQGDPTAPVTSHEYNLYMDGVRFGGFGMAIYALSCSIFSYIIEKLMVSLKPKYVYVSGIMAFAVGMFILAAWPSKLGVLILSITAGIIYAITYTIPYIILANYHSQGCFEMSNGLNIPLKEPRGIGTDISIISSMMFVAQVIISLSIGFLVSWTGTTCAIFYASSLFSVCAAVSAMFVFYI